jgi:hypothetical protein
LVMDQVYGTLEDGQLVLYAPGANDWNNEGYRIKYSNFAPLPLRRGWKCLRDAGLRRAFRENLLPAVQGDRKLVPCPNALLETVPEDESDGGADHESEDAEPPPPIPPKSLIPRGGAKREPKASQRARKRPPKRRRTAESQDTSIASEPSFTSPEQPSVLREIEAMPPSPPVFTLRPSKSVNIPSPLSFYTHVQVTTNLRAWSFRPTPRGGAGRKKLQAPSPPKPPPPYWTVNVGDVVIVGADRSKENVATLGATGANAPGTPASRWHPFTVPWHVAQVLSIYQRKNALLTSQSTQDRAAAPPETGPADEWCMEVRWFLRPDEMFDNVEPLEVEDPVNSIVEVDEYVESIPAQMVLARARLASSCAKDALGVSVDDDGVLTCTFLCQHMYVMQFDERKVRNIEDWFPGFGARLAGPLSRALLCEKAWPGKKCANRLQKAYSKFLIKRFQLKQKTFDSGVEIDPTTEDEVSLASSIDRGRQSWPSRLLDVSDTSNTSNQLVLTSSIMCHSMGREYLVSMTLSPCLESLKRFDARATATKSSTLPPWNLAVGDCVCLAVPHADHIPPPSRQSTNPWYPFQGPWKVAQVLSMYRDSEGEGAGRTLLEVRYFHRTGEVSANALLLLPPLLDDEVFESDIVEQDVSAFRLLSRCDVQGVQPLEVRFCGTGEEVVRRCRFFFLSGLKRFLPVMNKRVIDWRRDLLRRGIKFSKLVRGDPSLAESMNGCNTIPEEPIAALPTERPQPRPLFGNLYMSVPVVPQWGVFVDQLDLICPQEERSSLHWEVKVGDLVAASSEVIQTCNFFPLIVNWKPCQVLSIWSESHSEVPSKATVHWLPCDHCPSTANSIGLDMYRCGSDSPVAMVELASFLCPLTVIVNKRARVVRTTVPTFLPSAVVEFSSSYKGDANEIFESLLVKGVRACSCYDTTSRAKVFRVLGVNDAAVNDNDSESSNTHIDSASSNVEALGPPIYIAASTNLKFHAAVKVSTRGSVFEKLDSNNSLHGKPKLWEARLGDIVAVQGSGRWRRAEILPFTVPWSVAEVVTVFEQMSSNGCGVQDDGCVGIQIEVRWFYQPSEVSRFTRGKSSTASRNAALTSSELFESDHYEIILASRLLAPVALKESSEFIERGDANPTRNRDFEFTCCQFWSHHRKSLVPIGSLEGRISRGRAQSRFFGKYDALQSACARITPRNASEFKPSREGEVPTLAPEVAFQRVIDKLSLTDASKEALHESSGIVGRERERKVISSFLHDAVYGTDGDDKAFALFLAGPPGVG